MMRRYENRHRLLAIALAILAGFVDALGFLELRGMFVSFMSGNSTRMAVGVVNPTEGSLFAGALIAAFVGGVMAGTTVRKTSGRWRKQAVLAFVSLLLAAGSLAATSNGHFTIPTLLMAGAMGAANAVFQREGEVSVGVTYMTGTLVKLGQHLTAALFGGPKFAWAPYLWLWLGLVAGAIMGAAIFPFLGLQALWIATALTTSIFLVTLRLGPSSEPN